MLHRELTAPGIARPALRLRFPAVALKADLLFWSVSLTLMLADDAAMLAMLFY
jgi:hypothetical protein